MSRAVEKSDYQSRQNTALLQALAWFLYRHENGTLNEIHANNWNIGALEMNCAPTDLLDFKVDEVGNCKVNFGAKGMGS
jgi:hypothetical protein